MEDKIKASKQEYTIHLVPQFHYDVEYLKTYQSYLPIVLDNLLEAYKILSSHPQYTFLVEQTLLLEEFFKKYPELLLHFKRFAEEKRLEVSAGFYVMADLNMPSGESLVRQLVYGRKWLKKNFGLYPKVFHGGDCTGHNAQLPQIITKCGYSYYIFGRAIDRMEHEADFIWEGIDGTKVKTHWMRLGYSSCRPFTANEEKDISHLEQVIKEIKKHATSHHLLVPHGGDFARPSASSIHRVKKWNSLYPQYKVIFSTFEDYFGSIPWDKLKTYRQEFNPDRQGAYSSRIKIKQINRELENAIFSAEILSTIGDIYLKIPYPEKELNEAWKHILINQFHDIMWGTVIDPVMKNVSRRQKKAKNILSQIIEERLSVLSLNYPDKYDKKILIFNPLPSSEKIPINIDIKSKDSFKLINKNDSIIEIQREDEKITFIDNPPPMGCGVYYLKRNNQKESKINPSKRKKELVIENKFYCVKFTENGVIRSLILKETNQEFVDPSRPWFNNLCLQSDMGDLWQYYESPLIDGGEFGPHQDKIDDPLPEGPLKSKNELRLIGIVRHSKDRPTKMELIQDGPLYSKVKVQGDLVSQEGQRISFTPWKIPFTQYTTIYKNLRRIDFTTEIHPEKGKYYRIRAAFPTTIKNGRVDHEIPFGKITRPQGEFAALNWISYSDNEKGICLLNKGLPGNNVTDGIMMLSLMRSVAMEYKGPSKDAFEENTDHSFSYAIIPFSKAEEKNLNFSWQVQQFNMPLYYHIEDNKGISSKQDKGISGLFTWGPQNIICSALKMSNKKIILRVYESEGRKTECKIISSLKITKCEEANCLEESTTNLNLNGNSFEIKLTPFEIKTFLLDFI